MERKERHGLVDIESVSRPERGKLTTPFPSSIRSLVIYAWPDEYPLELVLLVEFLETLRADGLYLYEKRKWFPKRIAPIQELRRLGVGGIRYHCVTLLGLHG